MRIVHQDGIQSETENIYKYACLLGSFDHIVQGWHGITLSNLITIKLGSTRVQDIILDCPFESKGRLGNKTDVVNHVFLGQIRHFLTTKQNMSTSIFVELSNALGQSALATAGETHQGQLLSRLQ